MRDGTPLFCGWKRPKSLWWIEPWPRIQCQYLKAQETPGRQVPEGPRMKKEVQPQVAVGPTLAMGQAHSHSAYWKVAGEHRESASTKRSPS